MRVGRIVGGLDATFAWDGTRLFRDADLASGREPPSGIRGAAATVSTTAGRDRWRIVRDPVGLNKLFWAAGADGEVRFAARPWRLVEVGYRLDEIAAVPRGLVFDISPGRQPSARSLIPETWWASSPAGIDVQAAGREIREQLDRYLGAIAARHGEAPVFVCLSGGIDSTGIAALVADHFPDAVAISFDLARRARTESDDRSIARRVARDLGLRLLEATVTPDELLDPLDIVLREGIDWRDFNVHAALVNAALARAIADTAKSSDGLPLVFTGDLANEFLVDYLPERFRGRTYYALPRLSPVALRSLLVRGLDTCHREVGIFAAWGLAVVQPYAIAVDTYMRLSGTFLRVPDRKPQLARAIFGGAIPGYVLTRDKARAQIGGPQAAGGILAVCVDRGIDGAVLRQRFAELHGHPDGQSLDRFIRAGRYRSRPPFGLGLAHE